jgi:serine/threonine-protein kinase
LPLDEALPIARQIADALEAAHEQGIMHRDLKPANIKVRPDGTVKVLDFGLAKAMDPHAGSRDPAYVPPSQMPTMTPPALMTGAGMILGTAAYMSPEQAKGRPVDKRADIWAFGCVLYEILTGTSLFASESVAESLGLIFSREPDMSALPARTPERVRTLIARCLVKDARQRLRDFGEARIALEGAFDAPSVPAPAPVAIAASPAWRRALPIVIAVAATAIVVGFGIWALTRPAPPQLVRLTMTHPEPEVVGGNQFDANVALSPSGRHVAYVANAPSAASTNTLRLYVRALEEIEPRVLSASARSPFFSPDGQWVAFVEGNARLSKVPLTGGPSTRIADVGNGLRGASWGDDNTIVFATSSLATGLSRMSAAGGAVDVLTKPDTAKGDLDHVYPEVLPGGRAVLFTITVGQDAKDSKIAVLDLETRTYRVVLEGGSDARYSASGHLVYGLPGSLRAVGFDLSTLAVRGAPVDVDRDVITTAAGAASFGLAQDGTLIKLRGRTFEAQQNTLAWIDSTGREEPLGGEPRRHADPALSPDGTRVVVRIVANASIAGADSDLWVWSQARKTMSRLTFEPGFHGDPLWTPDGTRIVYRNGNQGLFWRPADGTGTREQLISTGATPRGLVPRSWSPDGHLLFQDPQRGLQTIAMVSVRGDRTVKPLLSSPQFNVSAPSVSPDGRWLAYVSNESGRGELYVRPFPDMEAGKLQVSSSGAIGSGVGVVNTVGATPRWTADSRRLFFADAPGIMMSRIEVNPTFSASTPERVLIRPAGTSVDFSMSPDGSRFLVLKDAGVVEANAQQLVVVLNWLEELKRLVPTT